MGMSECMKLVARMGQADQDDLLKRVDDYITSGIAPSEAQRMAGRDMLAEIEGERSEIQGLADEQVKPPVLSRTETPEFKKWFGDSKVVDADGKPLVVYHGTSAEIGEFNTQGGAGKTSDTGAFFTSNPKTADTYASDRGGNVIPVYLNLRKPAVVDAGGLNWNAVQQRAKVSLPAIEGRKGKQTTVRNLFPGEWDYHDDTAATDDLARWARKQGYDGLVVKNVRDRGPSGAFASDEAREPSTLYVAFHPSQVKSAIGNNGQFDPENDDIRFSREEPQAGPGFYSALRRELAKAKTNASPADYWTNLIKGAINKGAVKADELKWSGLGDWLAGREGKVPKAEVLAWLDERAPVEEVGAPAEGAGPVETPEFKKWFGEDSNLRDENGKPMVLYHGTGAKFITFKRSTYGAMGPAVYLGDDPEVAEAYKPEKGGRIMEVYARGKYLTNMEWTDYVQKNGWKGAEEAAKADGWAGVHDTQFENAVAVWDPRNIKSATGNNGQFDETNPDIRFSRNPPYAQSQVGSWKIADDSRFTRFIYNIQDKHIDTRDVTKAIQASVGVLGDRENAALRETLYLGRVTDRQKRFLEEELKPINTMLHAAGLTYKDLGEYLHARHAEERNAAMMAINPGRPDNDALSGMSDSEAQRVLAGAAPALPRIAARVDAIIEGTRRLMEVAGLETPDTVQALRDAYTNYTPLHRDEANPDHRMAQGQGFSVKGSNLKRATGSTATVDHELILAHIAEAREATIVRAEKNLVGLSLYSLAMRNPNPDFWSTDNPPTITVIDPRTGNAKVITDPMYKAKDNVLVVKVNGEDRTITFNEHNDRALRMVESLKNLDVDKVGMMVQTIGKATRYLAAINTQYNPVFAITNNMRDIQEALINLKSAGIQGKKAQVLKDTYANALWAVGAVERKGAAATGQWADLYRELSARGGLTGYRESFETIHDRLESIRSELAKQSESGAKKALLAAPRAIGGAVSVLNTAVENSVRLAVYKAALDSGMTKDQAAAAAKGITVNFNRKGQMSNQFGSLYAFFNAAVQGTARTVHTLRSPGGQLILSGAILAGFLQAMLLGAQPDDEEENLKDFTKDLNYVVPLSWAGQAGKYLTIPMAQGMKALVGLGRHMGEMVVAMKDGKRVDPLKHVMGIISLAMDSYNPLGNAPTLGQLGAPTLFKPVVQLAENKDWTGAPVYRERGPYGQFKSGSSLGRDNTAKPYKVAADLINRASGGTEKTRDAMAPAWASPQPEALRLLVETVGGGVMRETNKLFEYGVSKLDSSKEPVDTNRVPLVGRFLADTTTNAAPSSKYYENINEVEKRAKTLKDIEDSAAAAAFEKKYPEVALERQASRLRKEISKLRAERREAAIEGAPDRELKTYDADIAERMRDFNKDFRETVNAR